MNWTGPPTSRTDLKKRIDTIIAEGRWHRIPLGETGSDGGPGAPGTYLEKLLCLNSRNKDNADSNGIEVKFFSGKSLITLFHLECDDAEVDGMPVMAAMVKTHGWLDKKGRMSLRHTIKGNKSTRFRIVSKRGFLIVQPLGDGPSVRWEQRRLETAAIQKLGRVALVHG